MPSNRPEAVPRGERPGALPHQAKVILSGWIQVSHRYEPRAANWTLHYGDDSSSARLPPFGSDMARRSRRLMFQANQSDRLPQDSTQRTACQIGESTRICPFRKPAGRSCKYGPPRRLRSFPAPLRRAKGVLRHCQLDHSVLRVRPPAPCDRP